LRTKIICTIGPASIDESVLGKMVESGMDVARVNFSHGDHDDHMRYISIIRKVAKKSGRPVAILADLSGPKIRIGIIAGNETQLVSGAAIRLTGDDIEGDSNKISVNSREFLKALDKDDVILMADGMLQLSVVQVDGIEVDCRVDFGGTLRSNQGVSIPGKTIDIPSITEKDIDDLEFIVGQEIDWIAMSFVRTGRDVSDLRDRIKMAGKDIPIISKIEKHEAIDNIDGIIESSDALMLARGDLGVEIRTEAVPVVQKDIITKAEKAGRPVIVATQMLESMIDSPRPTRAEASDVANAIIDGADAVMLSGETAIGNYPAESVEMMKRIGEQAESMLDWDELLKNRADWPVGTSEAISYATCQLSLSLKVKAIITPTQTGQTSKQVSRFRPKPPIIAVSPHLGSVRRLMLSWGVYPIYIDEPNSIDEMLEIAKKVSKEEGLVEEGDTVIITAGTLVNVPGTTNLIKVDII